MAFSYDIHGDVAAGFEPVADAFERNFSHGIELGASFCVYSGDTRVVHLWGGWRDAAAREPWTEDTLVNVYSTTKGLGALALALCVDDGRLDYERPVAAYWPEFAQGGKAAVTVAQLLAHQAGLAGLRERTTIDDLYDHEAMAAALAAAQPLWTPGAACGYHAITWGFLAGELVRRVTGETLGALFRERVAQPLGADAWIGLPDTEHARCATLNGPNRARRPQHGPAIEPGPARRVGPFYPQALENPLIRPYQDASSGPWRRAELPAANGHANAAALARIYAALAGGGELGGVRLLEPASLAAATTEMPCDGEDQVLGERRRWARGYLLNTEGGYGTHPDAFGHNGAGGSFAFCDPDRGVSMSYVMNQMQVDLDTDARGAALMEATWRSLRASG